MRIVLLLYLFVTTTWASSSDAEEQKILTQVTTWAEKLGREFWDFGIVVTRKKAVLDNYKNANIEVKDGDNLTNDIASKIKAMMDQKVRSVERLMDTAGQAATADEDVDEKFDYYNAKNLTNNLTKSHSEKNKTEEDPEQSELRKQREKRFLKDYPQDDDFSDDEPEDDQENMDSRPLAAKSASTVSDGTEDQAQASQQDPPEKDYRVLNLTENPNFFNIPVNTEHSAVHVPSNVYDRSKEVISGIKWSENLDSVFKNNYQEDPTLSWQYFGSSTGFMRQFPAMIWKQDPVDLFDCRTRSWYIEAASSPKDIVVLVDKSGSMTGMRKEIAKHVVNNILDTLGNNDYVNIFTFSNVTEPLIDCFNDTLVQANLGNVRALKEEMDETKKFKTENIANFSNSLIVAFKLLENYRIGSRNKSGAGCNQAIMLITDGVQYNYKEIFEQYNWYTRNNNTLVNVRIFTYLIGREVSDVREVKWMACANQGYYVHLSTFAEVREQVLQYIPVMARPMVLTGEKPQPTWSPVYADVADPKLTNWLWVQRLRRDQKAKFLQNKTKKVYTNDQDKKYVHQQKKSRIANLLGVAGTDVPIQYIQQLMMPHLLGVNAYAFIITNNGYILIHPDLRPVFQGILKPAYNRVDMAEIELPDDGLEPRDFNRTLIDMRRDVVKMHDEVEKKKLINKKELDMKYHIDDMKRVIRGKRYYHYTKINDTPFTLVVTLPDKYGTMKIQPPFSEDIHRMVANEKPFTKYFAGNKWKIHPDWIYCRYLNGNLKKFNSSEDELRDFLSRMEHEHWKWQHPKPNPTEICDRSLMQSLVYDAKVTKWFDNNIILDKGEKRHELVARFGITVAFVATHSGLTRWQDIPQNVNTSGSQLHFSEIHNRAIDEIWYKRAVEQHYVEENSFVYAVPFDASDDNETLITASHAVFLDNGSRKAPAAVVGYQFYRTAFFSLFKNITSNCGEKTCADTCNSNNLDCYVLDNNAYVILSYEPKDTGKWFGDINRNIMEMLVRVEVYKYVRMYDYQAVCFPVEEVNSPASTFITPFRYVYQSLQWWITTLLYFIDLVSANQEYEMPIDPTTSSEETTPPLPKGEKDPSQIIDKALLIDKTKPTPCDKERYLYELKEYHGPHNNPFNKKMENCSRPFIAQRVPFSNLILLVIRTGGCKVDESLRGEYYYPPHPVEIDYNTSLPCRIREDDLYRKRYAKCINRHDNESQIQLCGKGSHLSVPSTLILISITLIFK